MGGVRRGRRGGAESKHNGQEVLLNTQQVDHESAHVHSTDSISMQRNTIIIML